jgi:hypothetical protein
MGLSGEEASEGLVYDVPFDSTLENKLPGIKYFRNLTK